MKQTESLTESEKASNLALLSSSERLSLRETMRDMEAKEWINRFQTKRKAQGFGNTKVWWEGVLDDSAKKRCQTAKRVAKSKQGNADQKENSDQTNTTGNAQVTLSALPNEQTSVSAALPREREEKSINTPIPPSGAKTGQSAISLPTWLATIKAMGEDPIPADDPVFGYADSVGIPRDHLRLAWREFRERYSLPNAKRYRCWRTVFRKAVRGNWLKLWHFAGDECALTTTGVQAKRAAEANAGVMA